ncbi:hypothetical protein ZEAMMB73_Zm00001d010936 [Zea mays]|uniref:Uncharacterized protein n=1 Tax=Zea mays TaxID=4577 RepID=A0A1D6FV00_MAIZE|nr:hypothetical protein ZEAMMB73_Zm00001d010936 [Zea mays]
MVHLFSLVSCCLQNLRVFWKNFVVRHCCTYERHYCSTFFSDFDLELLLDLWVLFRISCKSLGSNQVFLSLLSSDCPLELGRSSQSIHG